MRHGKPVVADVVLLTVVLVAVVVVGAVRYYFPPRADAEAHVRQVVVPQHLAAMNAEAKTLGWTVKGGAVTFHRGRGARYYWGHLRGIYPLFVAIVELEIRGGHGQLVPHVQHRHFFYCDHGRTEWMGCLGDPVNWYTCAGPSPMRPPGKTPLTYRIRRIPRTYQ